MRSHTSTFDRAVLTALGAPDVSSLLCCAVQAKLLDPSFLNLCLIHEDLSRAQGAVPRRQPPNSSRYTYEKPVKIYG
jgi:hypothetical protein